MKDHPEDCEDCAESLAAMDEADQAAALEVADAVARRASLPSGVYFWSGEPAPRVQAAPDELTAATVAGTLSPEEQDFLHRVCTGGWSSRLRWDQLELAERLSKRELIEQCGDESERGVPYRRTQLGDAVARLNEADQATLRWDVPPVVEARLLEDKKETDMAFTHDNTEGWTDAELAELNSRFEVATQGLNWSNDSDEMKHIQERLCIEVELERRGGTD